MVETFELTNYNFYSSRLDMELITNIVDTLKEILEEDKKQEQPLFLKVADDFIMNIARKVVQEKKKTLLPVKAPPEKLCLLITLLKLL